MDLQLSRKPDAIIADVQKVRDQIQSSALPGIPLSFSEWSTSYDPRDLTHASYVAASYIVDKLKHTQGLAQGMSYWTCTDLFEEPGPPGNTFHGGFGLMTKDGVRKASWFAYKYLNTLKGNEIPSTDSQSWAAYDGHSITALVWDFQLPDQKGSSNKTFFSKLVPNQKSRPVHLSFSGLQPGNYKLTVRRTGYKVNDAYSSYIDMGSPTDVTPAQLKQLQNATKDTLEIQRTVNVGKACTT